MTLVFSISSLFALGLRAEEPVVPTVRLAGEIRFKKTATIFLTLLTEDATGKEIFAKGKTIKLQTEDIKRGVVAYEFSGLQPGRYALKCYQDVNENRKLDIGMFGPKEPWATYRPVRSRFGPPKYDDMVFEIRQDISNANMTLD